MRVLERGEKWVLKLGSDDDTETKGVCRESLALFQERDLQLIIVHGGSEDIDRRLTEKGIPIEKKDGLRVTSPEVLKVVLASLVERNAQIIHFLGGLESGRVVPIYGHEIAQGRRYPPERGLGLVGQVTEIAADILQAHLAEKKIPVISTGCQDFRGQTLNVNADDFAAAVVRGMGAHCLIFTGKASGVLIGGQVVQKLSYDQTWSLLEKEHPDITVGMIPKLKAALWALEQENPPEVHICQTSGKCLQDIARGEAPGTLITIGE